MNKDGRIRNDVAGTRALTFGREFSVSVSLYLHGDLVRENEKVLTLTVILHRPISIQTATIARRRHSKPLWAPLPNPRQVMTLSIYQTR